MAARKDELAVDWPTLAASMAATQRWRPDPHEADWAGAGFSQPGPAEHSPPSRRLFRAALEDALAFTTSRDSCDQCDGARLCQTHTRRAARAEQYKQALKQEMETGW